MFSESERDRLRDQLIERAERDVRVSAAALVGSMATGKADRWSDIDLAFKLGPEVEPAQAAADWTAHLYTGHGAIHHLDLWVGETLYRAFLFANTLQIDLSFWTPGNFARRGPAFRLLFGEAEDPVLTEPPAADVLIGWGWLYALHARSSIARGRCWQAAQMMDGLRDQVVALACLRYGLPAHQGRGVDDLPAEVTDRWRSTLVRSVDAAEERRALDRCVSALIDEARLVAPALGDRLAATFRGLARPN